MISEKKILLSGEVKIFSCELLLLDKGFGVLKYVIDQRYDIGPITLHPGDITIALYWQDRPYTLYIWRLNQGQDTAYYFNVADWISLQSAEFIWRDLVVDVLVDPHGNVHVLDEHELPRDLDPALSRYIQSAKDLIIRDHQEIIKETDAMLRTLRG
jgi:Protein of unknown function (DUF402)